MRCSVFEQLRALYGEAGRASDFGIDNVRLLPRKLATLLYSTVLVGIRHK
jgi:hypothetical protein